MKIPKIADAVGGIDESLIKQAEESKRNNKRIIIKWCAVAAAVALVAVLCAAVLPTFFEKETAGRYKDVNITTGEDAIIWPWEYLSTAERFTELTIDGTRYQSSGSAVDEKWIGDRLGVYTVAGFDPITDEKHDAEFEVYSIKSSDRNQLVAVLIEGKHYVFKNSTFSPPSTLGELFNTVKLSEVIELSRFSENGDGPDKKHFALLDDEFIWNTLSECKDAPFVTDEKWSVYEKNYISFSVTSEVLGIYKRAMYITEDGYLWTNAFDYCYLFDIGKDMSAKIIEYAKKNAEKAEYQPYLKTITGTITEITDDYILIDDSILCRNPKDGITYKVPINDLRISRYVKLNVIGVGSTAQISYKGEIEEGLNLIENVVSISKVVISDKSVFLPE